MSSKSLSSIFNYKSNNTSHSISSKNVSKRSTMSFITNKASSNNISINTNSSIDNNSITTHRYATLSKVGKRFSSIMLVNKKNAGNSEKSAKKSHSYRRIDSIFHSSINNSSVTSLNSSVTSLNYIEEDSDDDDELITPTTSIPRDYPIPTPTISIKSVLSTKLDIEQETDENKKLDLDPVLSNPEPTLLSPIMLMVLSELQHAFEEAEDEIEKETEISRSAMIQSIHKKARYIYY